MFFFLRVIGSGALPLAQDRRQPLSPDAEGMAKPPPETEWRSHPRQKKSAGRPGQGPRAGVTVSGGSGGGLATQLCCTVQFRSEGIRRYLPKVLSYNFLVSCFFTTPALPNRCLNLLSVLSTCRGVPFIQENYGISVPFIQENRSFKVSRLFLQNAKKQRLTVDSYCLLSPQNSSQSFDGPPTTQNRSRGRRRLGACRELAPSNQESTTYEPSLVCKLLILGCRLLIPDRLLEIREREDRPAYFTS